MSVPVGTCLQCHQSRKEVKANNTYCATVDYFGECQEEWERHHWRDWSDAELRQIRVLPEFMGLYRRTSIEDLQFVDCSHQGREHTPWDGDDGPPPYICVGCWHDLRKLEAADGLATVLSG